MVGEIVFRAELSMSLCRSRCNGGTNVGEDGAWNHGRWGTLCLTALINLDEHTVVDAAFTESFRVRDNRRWLPRPLSWLG
jgi:hypothetical protein